MLKEGPGPKAPRCGCVRPVLPLGARHRPPHRGIPPTRQAGAAGQSVAGTGRNQGEPAAGELRRQRCPNSFDHGRSQFLVGYRQEQAELVAAQPGHEVAQTQIVADGLAGGPQHLVADDMAM